MFGSSRVVTHDFISYLKMFGSSHVLLHTILFHIIDVWFITCCYTRFYFILSMFGSSRVVTHDFISYYWCLVHHALLHTILFYIIDVWFITRCYTRFCRSMKLVFFSIDITGSFSWFAVLILLKCKSGVNISPALLLFWFCRSIEVGFSSIDIAGSFDCAGRWSWYFLQLISPVLFLDLQY